MLQNKYQIVFVFELIAASSNSWSDVEASMRFSHLIQYKLGWISLWQYLKFSAKYEVVVGRKADKRCMIFQNKLLLEVCKNSIHASSSTT